MNEQSRGVLDRYRAGEISAEIALMHLALHAGGVEFAGPLREAARRDRRLAPLAQLADAHREDLAKLALLVERGLVEAAKGGDRLAAIREQFERAVALAPEAAVALYSLGSAEILDRATAEIVARLDEWRLLGLDRVVIDIGCGIGRLERALSPRVGLIVGCEIAGAMAAEARRRCRGFGNVALVVCSGRDLALFAHGSADLLLAVDSFPYLVAADPAIAAAHVEGAARLLRPGGALLILNYSYRGDLAADRAEVARLAAAHGFALARAGTRDLALWDGATFLLTR